MKKEIKIALVAIAGIMIMFFGMTFLKGLSLFSTGTSYIMKFNDISGLSTSSPVYANGYKVGTIKNINYNYDKVGDIQVEASIDDNMTIPEGTRAEISSDLLGNVQVKLLLANSGKALSPGGFIDGRIDNGAMGELKNMIPYIQEMLPKLDSILTSVNTLLADPAIAASVHNVNRITSDLTTSTQLLNNMLAQLNREVPALSNKAGNVLDGASATMLAANGMIANINGKMDSVDIAKTMSKVEQTLANVQELSDKLNSKEGSLGMLMNDKGLYNNLSNAAASFDSLMTNIKAQPKRYVHFSVFGKK
jgi:phospholipid/cholesterol/gamma-HCH transport system substrate-binding protein